MAFRERAGVRVARVDDDRGTEGRGVAAALRARARIRVVRAAVASAPFAFAGGGEGGLMRVNTVLVEGLAGWRGVLRCEVCALRRVVAVVGVIVAEFGAFVVRGGYGVVGEGVSRVVVVVVVVVVEAVAG